MIYTTVDIVYSLEMLNAQFYGVMGRSASKYGQKRNYLIFPPVLTVDFTVHFMT